MFPYPSTVLGTNSDTNQQETSNTEFQAIRIIPLLSASAVTAVGVWAVDTIMSQAGGTQTSTQPLMVQAMNSTAPPPLLDTDSTTAPTSTQPLMVQAMNSTAPPPLLDTDSTTAPIVNKPSSLDLNDENLRPGTPAWKQLTKAEKAKRYWLDMDRKFEKFVAQELARVRAGNGRPGFFESADGKLMFTGRDARGQEHTREVVMVNKLRDKAPERKKTHSPITRSGAVKRAVEIAKRAAEKADDQVFYAEAAIKLRQQEDRELEEQYQKEYDEYFRQKWEKEKERKRELAFAEAKRSRPARAG